MSRSMLSFFAFSVLVISYALGGTSSQTNIKRKVKMDAGMLMDVTDFSIYYNTNTNQTIRKMMPRPWYRPGWPLRLPFYGGPCNCEGVECVCCTGVRIKRFNFTREHTTMGTYYIFSTINASIISKDAICVIFPHDNTFRGTYCNIESNWICTKQNVCTTLTYETTDSMINMNVTMNGEHIYKNSFSAANPPPFCIPLPIPYIPPGLVDMCMRIFDVSIVEQRLHACMDIDTRIDMAPVLILHFDCMNMGFDGVSLTKPGGGQLQSSTSNTTTTSSNSESTEISQVDSDVYDIVTESDAVSTTNYPFKNTIKYV